jgi:hypothetical protein
MRLSILDENGKLKLHGNMDTNREVFDPSEPMSVPRR